MSTQDDFPFVDQLQRGLVSSRAPIREGRWGSMSSGWFRVLIAASAAAVLLGGTILLTRESELPRVEGDEVFLADNLEELSAASDVIIHGTVTSVVPGRELEAYQVYEVDVQVAEVVAGSFKGDTIVFEEVPGFPDVTTKEGDNGYFFLHFKNDGSDTYRLVSSQGRILTDSGKVVASNDEMSWMRDLEGLSTQELAQRVASVASVTGTLD